MPTPWRDFCDTCGLLLPHTKDDCWHELVRKKKIGDAMFDAACHLLSKAHALKLYDIGAAEGPIENELVSLDLETWRWAT